MRRLIAISLLLLAGMPSLVSVFASDTDADLNLPACCRRNGTHHCQMNLQAAQSRQDNVGRPQISAEGKRCPAFPRTTALPQRNAMALGCAYSASAGIVCHPFPVTRSELWPRRLAAQSGFDRGPPPPARS